MLDPTNNFMIITQVSVGVSISCNNFFLFEKKLWNILKFSYKLTFNCNIISKKINGWSKYLLSTYMISIIKLLLTNLIIISDIFGIFKTHFGRNCTNWDTMFHNYHNYQSQHQRGPHCKCLKCAKKSRFLLFLWYPQILMNIFYFNFRYYLKVNSHNKG